MATFTATMRVVHLELWQVDNMKLRGYTDGDDWNIRTLLSMMADYRCWNCGVTWKEWRLRYLYTWYDGPIWQFEVGPFWIAILVP